MSSDASVEGDAAAPGHYSAAQRRIVLAAFELFAQHGVSGTSLQMIADEIGVTKAAVYHQFKSKDDIVLAVAETEMARIEAAIAVAEEQQDNTRAREVLLARVIDVAVERRRLYRVMQDDPYMGRFLAEQQPFQQLMERLFTILAGAQASGDMRVQTAMCYAAIGSAAAHPLVVDLDDETLRIHLTRFARTLFRLPD